jgi:hypothetical protein
MNRRNALRTFSLAAASAAVIALSFGMMMSAADARNVSKAPTRVTAKDKKPPICFEDGCKGDRCIFCTR